MAARVDSLSVLVVDGRADVLSFLARVLHAAGIRALLARDWREAVGIAERGYVPIDLVLAGVHWKDGAHAPDQVRRIRDLRPGVRALYMSAHSDEQVIRVELLDRGYGTSSADREHKGLIETLQKAAAEPLARGSGGLAHN